jgi:hypothetical protein
MDFDRGSRCLGTVVVHEERAMTCSTNDCDRRPSRASWFSMYMHTAWSERARNLPL